LFEQAGERRHGRPANSNDMYVLLFHDFRLLAKLIYRKGREGQYLEFSIWYLAFVGRQGSSVETDDERTAKYQVPITFAPFASFAVNGLIDC